LFLSGAWENTYGAGARMPLIIHESQALRYRIFPYKSFV
jgi:hypothetical protein